MSEASKYDLIVAFTDESGSFTNGFEAGQIWESMKRCDSTIEKTVHTENEETIRRMAHAEGYEIEWTVSEIPEWSFMVLTKNRRAQAGDLVSKGIISVIEGGGPN